MKTVKKLMKKLSDLPDDKEVRFFIDIAGMDVELEITEYDQDEDGNPTFFLGIR